MEPSHMTSSGEGGGLDTGEEGLTPGCCKIGLLKVSSFGIYVKKLSNDNLGMNFE